jgi:glycosyltransferase involved in cell wall biosynthesis
MKVSRPKVSVIVPVYNVHNYLRDCVDSILSQTYLNYEVILVDDGSTDGSDLICDKYNLSHSNLIKVVHKKNAGLNMARKSGFDMSSGDWIIFIDSDDIVHPASLEILLNGALKNDVDLAIGGYRYFKEKKEININVLNSNIEPQKITKEESIMMLLSGSPFSNIFMETAWGKLYKRSIIEKINWNYCNYRANEDEFMAIQYYPQLRHGGVLIPRPIYYYRINSESITRKKYTNIYQHKNISKFEMLEQLYIKSTEKLGQDYSKEILIRYYNQFLLFVDKYSKSGELDDSVVTDYDKYIKPKIEMISAINRDLNEYQKDKLSTLINNGVVGLITEQLRINDMSLDELKKTNLSLREYIHETQQSANKSKTKKIVSSIKHKISKSNKTAGS